MNRSQSTATFAHQHGVVLLEALVAILIFTVGILGLVGLQAAMVKNATDAKYRSEAGYIAQQTLGRMWADPCNLATYSTGDTPRDISGLLPNGTLSVVNRYSGNPPADTCVPVQLIDQTIVTVSWQLPGEASPHNVISSASITGG